MQLRLSVLSEPMGRNVETFGEDAERKLFVCSHHEPAAFQPLTSIIDLEIKIGVNEMVSGACVDGCTHHRP
jgi:hypothetical protein